MQFLRGSFYLAMIIVLEANNRSGSAHKSWAGYCVIPHCDDCKTHTRCDHCEKGYFIENWKCSPCTGIHAGCAECSKNGTCTKCAEGFHLSGGACQKCPDGCASCTSQSVCESCKEGYGKEGTTCVKCNHQADNCIRCSTAPNSAMNLVKNHNFEAQNFGLTQGNSSMNTLTSWDHVDLSGVYPDGPSVYHFTDAPDGPQALVVSESNINYKETQDISGLSPGQECTFSFYYRDNPETNNSGKNLVFYIGTNEVANVQTGGDVWLQKSGTFTPSVDTIKIYFDALNGGLYLVDDIEILCPGLCTQCKPGFIVSDGACVPCSERYDTECNECDESECKRCKDSFYLDNAGQCVTCTEKFENCTKCSVKGEKCVKCNKGYNAIDGACVYFNKSYGQTTCKEFMDDFHCKECNSGCFKMNYHCYPKINSCEKYYDNGMCELCIGGNHPKKNKC